MVELELLLLDPVLGKTSTDRSSTTGFDFLFFGTAAFLLSRLCALASFKIASSEFCALTRFVVGRRFLGRAHSPFGESIAKLSATCNKYTR